MPRDAPARSDEATSARRADADPAGPRPRGEGRGRLAWTLAAVLGAGGLALAHLEVLTRGPAYTGPLLVLDHLFDAALALLLVVLSAGAGLALLGRIGLEPERRLEALLHGVAVGAGLWSLAFLGLGAVGLLSPGWIWGALGVGGVLVRGELARLASLGRDAVVEIRRAAAGPWLGLLACAASAGAALFLFLHGSAPPGDWDTLMYHLEVPRRWLEGGRIFLLEGNLHVAFTGLVQLLYLPFLAVGSPAAASLLNGVFALLLGLAVFALGTRLLDAESGTLAAAVLWASTGLLMVAVTARLDTTLAFYLLLGHAALVAVLVPPAGPSAAAAGAPGERTDGVLRPERARRSLLLAALVLGLAVGVKYHALAYGACLAPVGLWAIWKTGRGWAERVRILGLVAGIVVVAALPWMAKNQLLLGAPFHPFFTERIFQPWLAELYGSTAIPEAVASGAFGSLGEAREPFDLLALFLAPERLTVEPEAAHYNLNLLLLLLPLGLLFLRRPAVVALAVPPLLYVAGVAVLRPTTNLRYLFPALAPLTIVASFLAAASLRKLAGASVRRPLLALLGAACLAPTVGSTIQWTRRAPVLEHLLGRISRQDYLAAGFGFYADLAGTVNRTVPPDGRVLLLWEARGFYLAPPHLQDNVLTNWPLLVPYLERAGGCLEETDITHVLASEGAVAYYVERGADPSRFAVDRFGRFADRCMEVAEEGPGFTLYRLEATEPSG